MKAKDILIDLLKFKSITPQDDGAMEYIANLMNDFEAKHLEVCGVKNLILTKKFGDGVNLCFAGHIDVVHPGVGWQSDPFNPVIKDGFIYSRGTQDMKSGVAAFLSACKHTAKFDGTLTVILTSDEEGDGIYGTNEALKYLEKNCSLPNFAVVAEPTCDKIMGDTIKIGRRGSINGQIIINGTQGHAAYPQKCINPVHQLAKVFADFAGHDLDMGSKFFTSSKIVITDIRGGMELTNVTPGSVKIMFNVRNSDLSSYEDVQKYVKKVFDGLDYTLNLKQGSKPFLTNENSKIVQLITNSIEKICNLTPALSTGGGTSDARYFAQFGVPVVEFGVINDRIHSINERVSIKEVEQLESVFEDLIAKFS